jgi:hypothetical protein
VLLEVELVALEGELALAGLPAGVEPPGEVLLPQELTAIISPIKTPKRIAFFMLTVFRIYSFS